MKNIIIRRLAGLSVNLMIIILILTAVAGNNDNKTGDINTSQDKIAVLAGEGWNFVRRGVWEKTGSDSERTVALFTETLAPEISGFGGHIPLYIFLKDNIISEIKLGKNVETPGYFKKLTGGNFFEQFIGQNITQVTEKEYDVVSRATVSSSAVIRELKKSVADYIGEEQKQAETEWAMITGPKAVAGLLVICFALVNYFFYKKNKWFRLLQMILNVGVLGYYSGSVLSLELLLSYARNGITLSNGIVFLVIMAIILLLNIFGKKRFYCSWVCPFGAAQELADKLTGKRFVMRKRLPSVLVKIRKNLVFVILFIAWMINGSYIFGYEPFAAFVQTDIIAGAALKVALIFLLVSVFIPKFWCRYICPTGALIDFVEKE